MALSRTTNKQTFTATGGDTQFTFDIPFFDAITIEGKKYGDIKLTREDTAGNLTQFTPVESFTNPDIVDGEFKLSPTNNDPELGGTVTISKAATGGEIFVVERDVAYTQEYDLQEGSTIDPTALNKAFDRVVAQNQQQNDLFTRTVEFPVTDSTSTTYTVSSETDRASKALGFDASGNVTEIDLVSSGQISGDTNAGISISNNIISAKVDNSTTQFSGGNISVKTVDTAQLAGSSVTTDKLENNAVTTNKIASDNVTYDKIQDITTSNSVLGNTGTGTVAERALVGDILLDQDDMSSDSAIKGATQQSIKAYVDVYAKPNIVFAELLTKQNINNGNAVTAGIFYDVPSLEASITTVKASSTFKVDLKLSFGSNLFNYETVTKVLYKVGSGSYQDFQLGTGGGSRTLSHFQHYSADSDARMNVLGGSIYLSGASYSVGDVLTFKVQMATVRPGSSGQILVINSSENDLNDDNHSRGTTTLIVQEF